MKLVKGYIEMSEKINLSKIIKQHFQSLVDINGKISYWDLVTFFILPLICSAFFVYRGWELSDAVIGIFINLGSIFTALLISVLIMLYDQEQKITDKLVNLSRATDPNYRIKLDTKRALMREVFANISYAIIIAILLVFSSLLYQILTSNHVLSKIVFMPLNVFFVVNLLLTFLMVVKRTHNLMSSK